MKQTRTIVVVVLLATLLLGSYRSVVAKPPAPLGPQLSPSDVTKPPLQLVSAIGGPNNALAIEGDYAYVGMGTRLGVVDISDPANPQLVGVTAPEERFAGSEDFVVADVDVLGDYAYVVNRGYHQDVEPNWNEGLLIVDISNPATPQVVGRETISSYPEQIEIVGNLAYVAGLATLHVFDLSNPT